VLSQSRRLKAIAPEGRGSALLRHSFPRIPITRPAKPGRSLRPGGRADAAEKSNSATDAAGLERLGLCIARPKQSSASHDQTTEAVANHWFGIAGARDRLVVKGVA
jgi:hypothetical protein